MTEINKAITFAKECLKWEDPGPDFSGNHTFIWSADRTDGFEISDAASLQELLDEFLAKRYLIQINRGTSTLFKWTVIVGLQDKSVRGAHLGEARADSDDLFDAIFDACVMAAKMDK